MSYKHELTIEQWQGDYSLQIEFNTIVFKGEIKLDDWRAWRGNNISGNGDWYDGFTNSEYNDIEWAINRFIDKNLDKFMAYHDLYQTETLKNNTALIKALNKGE